MPRNIQKNNYPSNSLFLFSFFNLILDAPRNMNVRDASNSVEMSARAKMLATAETFA
jgi:hypothetical protein